MSLDGNDIRILQVLQSNGRLSFRQIAEKVKVSVPTVSSKVSNLERMGAIRGYRANLDTERLGEMSAVVTIKARPSDLSAVAQRLLEDDVVRQMFFLSSGRLMLICTFTSTHLINDFAVRLGEIPEIVEYDIANVIGVGKEEDRASVVPGLHVVMPCQQCGRQMRDHPLKVREGTEEIYLCSPACMNVYTGAPSGR